MSDDKLDFRGKLLVDKSYSYKSQFVEQVPITDLQPYLDHAFNHGVKAFKWNQFVPGFNDGDPCEFTLYEVYATANDTVAELWAKGHSVSDAEELEYPEDVYLEDYSFILESSPADHPDGLTDDVDLPVYAAKFEYAIRAEFGDNCTVVITPESTFKFDYECGY